MLLCGVNDDEGFILGQLRPVLAMNGTIVRFADVVNPAFFVEFLVTFRFPLERGAESLGVVEDIARMLQLPETRFDFVDESSFGRGKLQPHQKCEEHPRDRDERESKDEEYRSYIDPASCRSRHGASLAQTQVGGDLTHIPATSRVVTSLGSLPGELPVPGLGQ